MALPPADTADLCKEVLAACDPGAGAPAADGTVGGGAAGTEFRLRWEPLVVVAPPGLSTLLSTIRTPLDVIKTILNIVAGILDALAALLFGLLDPFRALIMAAYNALKSLLEDLLNSGAYLYFDAPGITSLHATDVEMGLIESPVNAFKAGQEGGPPPPIELDGFDRWAFRFGDSFDDPGDTKRPIFSDGAAVDAVFIAMAAPSLGPLKQILYLIGKLLNLDPFLNAADRYMEDSPDPDLARARMHPVAPDWEAVRLKDLFPPLQLLLLLPELLKSLLLSIEGLSNLLAAMAQALRDKAEVLRQLVDALQAIIDLLDALSGMGLKVLAVSTHEGVEGLKRQFLAAEDRPDGGYVAGVCLLAAGPLKGAAAPLWSILGQSNKLERAALAEERTSGLTGDPLTDWANTAKSAFATTEALAVAAAGPGAASALGRSQAEIAAMAYNSPSELVAAASASSNAAAAEIAAKGRAQVRAVRKKGARSLAFGLGAEPPPASGKKKNS